MEHRIQRELSSPPLISMAKPPTTTGGSNTPTSPVTRPPGLLALMHGEFSVAKRYKKHVWWWDIGAAVLSVLSAFSPWLLAGILGVVAGLGCKLRAKTAQSRSRASFRLAERARRYDFQRRTLGWPPPAQELADMMLKFSSAARQQALNEEEELERGYYTIEGQPSERRLLANLHESMFSTEKLAGVMAERRREQFALSLVALVLVLVGTLLAPELLGSMPQVQALGITISAAPVLKALSIATTLLVSLDVFGEMRAFARTEHEVRTLASAILSLLRLGHLERAEGLRLMVDYNCCLMEMPLIPDEVRAKKQGAINDTWEALARTLNLK